VEREAREIEMSTNKQQKVNLSRCEHCGFEELLHAPVKEPCPRCARPGSQRFDHWIDARDTLIVNDVPVKGR